MINVAIVGTGAIAASHIEGFVKFPDQCRIVALVNRTSKRAESYKERYKLIDAKIYSSIEEMIDSGVSIDLAAVCLPPSMHCEASITLFNAKINVLCEKPLATSVEECDRMIDISKKNGVFLSTVSQNRFNLDVVKVHELIQSGLIGKLYFGQSASLWWRGDNYYKLHWRGTWESEGGGCTLNHGIHHLDLLLWFMGKAASVTAMVDNQAHGNSEAEDISIGIVKFKNGAIGNIVNSLLHHGEGQTLQIDAEKASVSLPLHIAVSAQRENGFPDDDIKKSEELRNFCDAISTEYTGHTAQIKDVLDAITDGREPLVTGEDGRSAIELIMAMYQSAFTGHQVQLPMTKDDAMYSNAGILAYAKRFNKKKVSVESFSDDTMTNIGGTL